MASDNEASCVTDPNFAVICSFLNCFGKSCGIEYPDIAMLQEMVENSQEVPQQLIDLHIKLLRKTRKTVTAEKWERALVKFCHTYSNQDGWELERFGYKKARIAVKLRLLKVLLEAQFDMNQRFKNEVNKLAANELRVEPLGRDKSGLAYWCQLDEECNIRVYREDLDEESWQLVAKDRDEVVNLISTLSNGEAGDIPVNEDSNSLEISEKPIIDTGQVTSSPSMEDVANGVEAEEESEEDEEDDEEEAEDEEDDEEEGEEDVDEESSQDDEESEDAEKPETPTKKISATPVSVEPGSKADTELKNAGVTPSETTVIKTSPIKVINIAELTKPQEERKIEVKVPIGITLTPVAKPVDVGEPVKTRESPKTGGLYYPNEPKAGQNKISLKPIDKLAANLVKLQAEKLEKPGGIKSLEKIAENLARSSLHGVVTSPEEDRQIPDFFPRNQPEKSNSSRSQRGMDLSTSPRGWESHRPVDFSGIDLSSRKTSGKSSELASPGYRAQDFQHKEIDLSTRKPPRPEISIPFDARTALRSHGVITDLSKRQCLPQKMYQGYDIPQAYRADHRLPNYTMLPDPSKIAAGRLGPSAKRALEEDDLPHDIAKRIHADVIPIRGTIEQRQQILGSNWKGEVGEAIEEPVMMVQGEGSGRECEGVNPGVGEAVDEPVLYFYGEGFGLECETGNPAEETPNPDSKESKNDETERDNVESVSEPGTSVNIEGPEAGTEADKTRFKPTLGVQVFNKTSGSPVKRLSRWDVRRPTEKTNAEHESKEPEPFKSQEETLSTIKESTTESYEEASETCDTKRSEVEKGEGSSLPVEEPCRHDSSTSIGAGLIRAIIPGLLAVPGAENLAEKQTAGDESTPLKSSTDNDLPEKKEADESMPRFFFGPNCVSFDLKKGDSKEQSETVAREENENIVKLADDLAKSVSIDTTKDSASGEESKNDEESRDSTTETPEKSTDLPVPETVSTETNPEKEIESDCTPVERFEKLAVSEAGTAGASKSVDSVSEIDDSKNETIEVNKSFEKLAVSEAESTEASEESKETENPEESSCLPLNKEDEEETKLVSESENFGENAEEQSTDAQSIEETSDSVDRAAEVEKEPIDSVSQVTEDGEKNVEESESIEEVTASVPDSQIHDEKIEEEVDPQTAEAKEVEDALPAAQSISAEPESSIKDPEDDQKTELSNREEPEDNPKTVEDVSEVEIQKTEDKEEETSAEKSSVQLNDSQLSEEFQESQTISDLGTINEDELLKSSSDSEQDQNIKNEKSNREEEVQWSSQSEAAEKIDKEEEDVDIVNKNEESEGAAEVESESVSKVDENPTIEDNTAELNDGSIEQQEDAVEKNVDEALDSLSEASLDDDRSQDESKEAKEDISLTANATAIENPGVEAESQDSDIVGEVASPLLANNEEKGDKSSGLEDKEDPAPKKDDFCINQITPAAITDSNVSKSPERINVDSKNEGRDTGLADITDYCNPASENPSSSGDQDSNEAMVIDDRVFDSNESSKDVGNEDSSPNEEKKLDIVPTVEVFEKTPEKSEKSCFNLGIVSAGSEQETVEIADGKEAKAEADQNSLSQLVVEKFREESELEEPEDIVENLTQDASTDDQKSLVANYDSSDRESDDVFENDLLDSTSNADEFNDSKSNELIVSKDEEEDLLGKVENEVEDAEKLPKEYVVETCLSKNENTKEVSEAETPAVEKEEKKADKADSKSEQQIQEAVDTENVEKPKKSSENTEEISSPEITAPESRIDCRQDSNEGESVTDLPKCAESEKPEVKILGEPGLDSTKEKSIEEAVETNAEESGKVEPFETLSNSTISGSVKFDEDLCKSTENQVFDDKEEEKSIENKSEVANASIPLTIAAKHSLEPDKDEIEESEEAEEEEQLEEEEPPIVHISKRFKEDYNASILADDNKELKEVSSLVEKDLTKNEIKPASESLNHDDYKPTEIEAPKAPENLQTSIIEEDKTTSDVTLEMSSSEKANSLSPIENECVALPVAIEANEKTEEEAPMSEDILTLKSKPVNSVSEVTIAHLEELRKPEIEIQDDYSKGEKIQIMENQIMKLSNEDQTSEIHRVNLGVVTIESDDSMGADNDNCFSNPQDEVDPLACVDEDPLARPIEANAASALGIRVKPVSELVYEGWKLDGTETPKISRKRRNSNHESNSEDVVMKDEDDESEGTGGKRMRLRGKRPPDMNMRRTIEEKRQEAASSDDEASKKPTDMVKEDSKDCDDVTIIDTVGIDKKRGRPRGKRKVRRTIRLPGQPAATPATDQSQPDSSVTETPAEIPSSPVISSDTPQKKRKKRKMVLGLEIGRDIVDTSAGGVDLNETPVRQSRRIAQIKIKEEADRRRIEEETLCEMKEKKDRDYVVGGSGDKRKRKKQKAESEEEVSSKEVEPESKAKKKRKKKKRKKKPSAKFDEQNPWRSSSGSSTEDEDDQDEDDDEDEEAESEGSVLFKSDHEFSPESDLEKDEESEPLRRARTARKSQSDVEEADDEYACQKCGKADHPEWILLCDTCDKGWHCSCLRPALMLIPEGDWFCPPCQHNLLVIKLQENLKKFDQSTKKHENELLRKKRLAFVGISLDNVLHQKESHQRSSRTSSQDSDNDSSSSASSSSQSGSSSSEESEPVYQLRERRCANTYKFNEYDDMINAAIQDEVEAVRGAGNQGRGKDIATIVNAEKGEAEAEALKINRDEVEDEDDDKVEKESDEDYKAEKDEDVDEDDDEDEKPKISAKKIFSRKKHRKLNSLDISSEDDPESDEDFKGSSSDDDDDPEDQASSSDDSCFDTRRRGRRGGAPVRRSTRARMTRYDEDFINDDSEDSDRPKRKKSRSVWDESESEESDNSWRQRKKRSKTVPTPKSRSANRSKSNKKRRKTKKQVIESDNQSENEDEEEVEPSVEKTEPEETPVVQPVPDPEQPVAENEEKIIPVANETGDQTEQPNEEAKEESKDEIVAPVLPVIEDEKVAAKKKETTPKRKKTPPIRRKIVYGGLQDSYSQQEEESVGRRTRGKKINYQEVLASDSEEELKKALKKTEESEDEFVVGEVEDLNEEAEKDSDSGDIYSPKKEGAPKPKGKSPKGKKPRKSKSPAASLKLGTSDNDTPKGRKKPGPKPGSKNKPKSTKSTPPFGTPRSAGEEGDVTEENSLAGLGAEDLAELDEEQLDQMMMEDEEYGKRQLELAAIEIARKKKEEREAKKMEKARLKALEILAAERQRDPNAPEGTDGEAPKKKKRGRRSKAEILAEQMRRDGAPNLSMESPSPNLSTAILSPGLNLSTTPLVSPSAAAPALPPNMTSPNLSSFLSPNTGGLNLTPNLTTAMVPNLPPLPIPDAHKIHESFVPGVDMHAFSPEGMVGVKPKRRGRGKGKKTLALEAARAAEAANRGVDHLSGFGTDSNPEMKSDDPNVLPTPGSSTSGSAPSTPPASIGTPSTLSQPPVTTIQQAQSYPTMPPAQQQSSVITRMLQSQPVSGGPQSFAAAAAAMGHKYFGAPTTTGNIMGVPRPGFDLQPRGRIPSPYRQPGQSPMPPHFAAVRSGTPPMRMRVPGPQMYHTPHHPMDPSPSGGGPISITSNRDRSSPSGAGLGPAMIPPAAGSPLAKGGPTPPPPPPYARGVPPMGRFPDSSVMGGPRHQIPPFTNASSTNHGLQQPSPPPNRASGNFSPYHPPPPPNYHYGAYPPPPPMTTADDAAAYQGSPYPNTEHFSTPAENPGPVQAPQPAPQPQTQSQAHSHPGETTQGNKQFDEEGTGEFGGLVSYFSSQREDDLDS